MQGGSVSKSSSVTVAIVAMLKAPRGVWGYIVEKTGFEFAPLERRVVYTPAKPATAVLPKGDAQ